MVFVRTLRRSTEVANLLALCAFEALGLFVLAVGIERTSAILVILGVLYAGGMAWYLAHLLTRVAIRTPLRPRRPKRSPGMPWRVTDICPGFGERGTSDRPARRVRVRLA